MNKISMAKILLALSRVIDLVSNTVVSHHKKVSYLTYQIAKEMNLNEKDLKNLVMAALIHDIGVFYIRDVNIHDFTFDDPKNSHAYIGYYLLNEADLLRDIAPIIKYHHTDWNRYAGSLPSEYNVLHLADQLAFLSEEYDIYNDSDKIARIIEDGSGSIFWPEAVEALLGLLSREYIALDLKSATAINRVQDKAILEFDDLVEIDKILDISKIISYIIDFRSPFTVTHSIGVGIVAKELSKLMGFSEEDQVIMEIAGYLHDLGKLAVAPEILNKTGKLSQDEWKKMRAHSYYTYQVLDYIDELPHLKEWAAYHHEKLDGTGYPFHLGANDLSTGSRIMTVADIFTAISEDRPYRKGMSKKEIIDLFREQVKDNKIDGEIVELLLENFHHINGLRKKIQLRSKEYYQNFRMFALSETG